MGNYPRRDQAISIRLSKEEIELIDKMKDKQNTTRHRWNKLSRSDVIVLSVKFALGTSDLSNPIV
jgi:hypothetical protein